jgi:hypothetical protein
MLSTLDCLLGSVALVVAALGLNDLLARCAPKAPHQETPP